MAQVPQRHAVVASKRAAIYVRVSKNRTDDAAKPDRQIKSAELLGRSKGLALVTECFDPHGRRGVFMDDDVSAYKGRTKRPGYESLMQLIRSGEVNVVLCWHIDRMLRTVREMTEFIDLAEETAVSIESVQGGSLDLSTPAGRMVATILSAVAQAEVELKAERHLLKNEQTRQAGGSTGGPVPFGWTLGERSGPNQPRPFVVDEAARTAVRGATLAIIGKATSLSDIARTWNAAGLETTFGKPWNHNNVRKILLRPRNAGFVDHRGEILEGVRGSWDPLVTEDEWRACRAILLSQARGETPRRHVLSNLLTCARCGHPMVAGINTNRVRGKQYNYEVYKHPPNIRGCGVTIRREAVDRLVRQEVRTALTFGDLKTLVPQSPDLSRAIQLRAEVGVIEDRMLELEGLWASGNFSGAGYKKQRERLSATRAELLSRLNVVAETNAFAGLLTSITADGSFETAAEIGRRFDALSIDHRKTVISTLFPRIEVSPGAGPSRLAIYNQYGTRMNLYDDDRDWSEPA